MRTGAAAALLMLTLSGCASTLPGDGELAAGADGEQSTTGAPPSADRTQSAPTASSPAPTPTTSPTTSPTATSDPDPGGLTCSAPAVTPPGAPYCYSVPGGLSEIDLGDPTAGEEGSFRTSFGFGPADHIDVQAYIVGVDTDGLSDEEIIAELAGVVTDLEAGGFDFVDEPELITVDGARGFVYPGTSNDGGQVITAHFVFRGVNEVQLNCAVTERPEVIATACADVLASMQVLG
ncbi:MAG: hypothetical protein H0T66_13865 [Geodermatophilaceae bacterium]|nr:hypothetical protein [Geodermatophilaceae bacterium]